MNPESCARNTNPGHTGPHSAAVLWRLGLIVMFALAVRFAVGVHFDGLDDVGYLEAAHHVADGHGTAGLGKLFRLRVGMAYPLGWLLRTDWVRPDDFRVLTLAAEMLTLLCLFAVGRRTISARAGLIAASLYSIYPLAIAQASRFDPVPFQVASVSLCLLFVTHAEGNRIRNVAAGLLAGLALGLGYLVKEDVALVVPALAVILVALRTTPRATALSLCAGAALVFGIESLIYWQNEGSLLYRLYGTSGAGTATVRLGAIWDALSYPRSLFAMPYQVGLFWWSLIPAMFTALRSPNRWLRAFAWALLVVGAYLQFGTNSLTSYLPLPRTPRYTAVVTPFLILVIAGWLSWIAATRRTLALSLAAVLFITAIPCVGYAAISGSERRRNTMAALPVIREMPAQDAHSVVYTDFYSARALTLLLDGRHDVRSLYHADFAAQRTKLLQPLESLNGVYLLLDSQSAKIYTSTYQIALPATIGQPPASWQAVWTHDAYPAGGLDRRLLNGLRRLNSRAPSNFVTRRVESNLADMLDGGMATLYYVTKMN